MTLCTRIAGRPGSSRTRSVAPNRWQPRDYDRLEAGLIELGRNRNFKDARKGSGKNYRSGVLREDVWRARENLQNALTGFEADANADLAAALRSELRGCVMRMKPQKPRPAPSTFSISCSRREISSGITQRCGRAFNSASSASSSTSSRTRIRCRPRSCCCWRPTIQLRRTGAKLARLPGSSFWSAIRSSRSIASGAPTSAFIAAYTRCCRRRALNA